MGLDKKREEEKESSKSHKEKLGGHFQARADTTYI